MSLLLHLYFFLIHKKIKVGEQNSVIIYKTYTIIKIISIILDLMLISIYNVSKYSIKEAITKICMNILNIRQQEQLVI